MNWFEGSIEEAVKAAKMRNCFFAIYVEGNDKLSEIMTSVINSHEISTILESDKFVSVKVTSGSEEYNYFVKIYKHVPIPSLFLIGINGVPVAVVHNSLDEDKQIIYNEVLKAIKGERNVNNKEDIFRPEASTSKRASFIKVKEMTNSSVDKQNSIKSLPLNFHDSRTDRIFISTPDAVFRKTSDVSCNENQHRFITVKQDGDEIKKNVSILKKKDLSSIVTDEEDEQDSNKDSSFSLTHSVLEFVNKEVTNDTVDVGKVNKPLFGKRTIVEDIREGTSASGTVTENMVFQSTLSDVSEINFEQLEITEKSILKDCRHEKSEASINDQSSQQKRTLYKESSPEVKQKGKKVVRGTKEKIENDLDRQRILKEIAIDRKERLDRECDIARLQRRSLIEPVGRTHNSQRSGAHCRGHTLIQFRTSNGLAVTEVFSVNSTISDLRSFVIHNIELRSRQFNLAVAFPSHTFTAEENNKTLEELELVPNAVVLILPVTDSNALSWIGRRVSNMFWHFISPMVSLLSYARQNVLESVPEPLRFFFSGPLLTFLLLSLVIHFLVSIQ